MDLRLSFVCSSVTQPLVALPTLLLPLATPPFPHPTSPNYRYFGAMPFLRVASPLLPNLD